MSQTTTTLSELFDQAKAALEAGRFTIGDLERLRAHSVPETRRQRLLYLHAAHPSIHSPVVAAALHEPIPGSLTQIDPLAPDLPYQTVFDAILEGWRVIHFPLQRAPFEDREIDIVGYEFILEKWEAYDAR